MRIDKFLSNLKYASRNEIKKIIKDKRVIVNENVCLDASFEINPLIDIVYLDENKIFFKKDFILALNKKSGYICSNKDEAYPSILNLLPEHLKRLDLKICGRLDFDTTGLVLLTDNGDYVHKIISPKKDIKKIYYVKTKLKIINYEVLTKPHILLDGKNEEYSAKGSNIELISDDECYVELTEGKFHQVKRMFELIDNEVIELKRVQIGDLKLDDLEDNDYAFFELSKVIN